MVASDLRFRKTRSFGELLACIDFRFKGARSLGEPSWLRRFVRIQAGELSANVAMLATQRTLFPRSLSKL